MRNDPSRRAPMRARTEYERGVVDAVRVCTAAVNSRTHVGIEGRCAEHMLNEIRTALGVSPVCLCCNDSHASWCPCLTGRQTP